MADNVGYTPGTGATIAADDIAGVLYQRVKIGVGADGSATDVSSTNPMPVSGTFYQATQPVSGTVTANAGTNLNTSALALETGGNLATLVTRTPVVGQTTMAGSRPVVIASDQSTLPVNQAGVSTTGTLAAASATVALTLNGASGWAVDLRGTFVATMIFQGTVDGTNWVTLAAVPVGNGVNVASVVSATAAGAWIGSGAGLQQVRVQASAYTSGTVTVVIRASSSSFVVTSLNTGATTLPISGTLTGVTTVSTVTNGNLGFPGIITDVTSAALTTTTTSATFTPTYGCSYMISIPVTAVSGTSPTLDITIQESEDSGTNWFNVYDFPRITATGSYRSPVIPLTGNRVRYVQTVSGTTPSFTRAINRLQSSQPEPALRQMINRTIDLNTLNSTTATMDARDCGNRAQLVVNIGTVTSLPSLQMEGSDDNGLTWYAIGSPLTAVASATTQLTVVDINSQLMRARVSTAGSSVTAGYVLLKAHD